MTFGTGCGVSGLIESALFTPFPARSATFYDVVKHKPFLAFQALPLIVGAAGSTPNIADDYITRGGLNRALFIFVAAVLITALTTIFTFLACLVFGVEEISIKAFCADPNIALTAFGASSWALFTCAIDRSESFLALKAIRGVSTAHRVVYFTRDTVLGAIHTQATGRKHKAFLASQADFCVALLAFQTAGIVAHEAFPVDGVKRKWLFTGDTHVEIPRSALFTRAVALQTSSAREGEGQPAR